MSSDNPSDDKLLSMTVHSLPHPQDLPGDTGRTRVGRWKMLVVLLVCIAPVVASYLTFYVVRPEGRRNFGELIDPQRPLPDVVATTLEGGAVNLQTLKDQWLLMSVASGTCDAACTAHLYLQRQLREGLGKDKDRLDWVWLIDDATPLTPQLAEALKGATVLRVAPQALSAWLQPQPGYALKDHLYLVDPRGQWMMRFPPSLDTTSASKVRRDLERLLRASVHWDKAGR